MKMDNNEIDIDMIRELTRNVVKNMDNPVSDLDEESVLFEARFNMAKRGRDHEGGKSSARRDGIKKVKDSYYFEQAKR